MLGSISDSLTDFKGSIVDFGASVRDLIDITFGSAQELLNGGNEG